MSALAQQHNPAVATYVTVTVSFAFLFEVRWKTRVLPFSVLLMQTPVQKSRNLRLEICRRQSLGIISKAQGWPLRPNAGCGRRVGSSSPWRWS